MPPVLDGMVPCSCQPSQGKHSLNIEVWQTFRNDEIFLKLVIFSSDILTFLAEEKQKSSALVINYNIFGEFVLVKIGSSEHLKQSRHIVHDLTFCHIHCFFATGGRSFEAENVLSKNERAVSEVLHSIQQNLKLHKSRNDWRGNFTDTLSP